MYIMQVRSQGPRGKDLHVEDKELNMFKEKDDLKQRIKASSKRTHGMDLQFFPP
jgi:hypothetical protein